MHSATFAGPSSRLKMFVREVPRIVPPRGRIPRVDSIVSSSNSFSSGPRQPSRKPTIASPWMSMPLRTIARITAFRPGQSPPPVSTPTRTHPRYRGTSVVAQGVVPGSEELECRRPLIGGSEEFGVGHLGPVEAACIPQLTADLGCPRTDVEIGLFVALVAW